MLLAWPSSTSRAEDAIQSAEVQRAIDDLIDTMRAANGAGLAAPQVLLPLRICVIEVAENPRYPYFPPIPLTVLINPEIDTLTSTTFSNYEGCLSVPNLRGRVERHMDIELRYRDRFGAPCSRRVRGLEAGVYQHECDHLDGTLFIDRVTDTRSLTTPEDFIRFHRDAYLIELKARLDM
jgi:peptide deformylase